MSGLPRVAVAGAGHLGRIHARIWAETEGIEFAGVADPSPEARDAVARELGCVAVADVPQPQVRVALPASDDDRLDAGPLGARTGRRSGPRDKVDRIHGLFVVRDKLLQRRLATDGPQADAAVPARRGQRVTVRRKGKVIERLRMEVSLVTRRRRAAVPACVR